MKTLPTKVRRRRNHGPCPPRIARLRRPNPPRIHPHPRWEIDTEYFSLIQIALLY
jgi:hypothetical protein